MVGIIYRYVLRMSVMLNWMKIIELKFFYYCYLKLVIEFDDILYWNLIFQV